MRFSVDAHALGQRLTGNEVYIRSLLDGFARLDTQAEFVAYVSAPEAPSWVPARFEIRRVTGNRYWRLAYDFGQKLRQLPSDLVHVQYNAPLWCPTPIVVTVHDVSFLEHPEYFPPGQAWQLRLITGHTLRRAAKILTVSEFSRQRIARGFGLNPDDICVTPEAAQPQFRPGNTEAARARLRERFGLKGPYLLNVGDVQPRKNSLGLLRAFRELITSMGPFPHTLVLAGKETWFSPEVRRAIQKQGLSERVLVTGFVSDAELADLYHGADLFVFPSFYEGYGLPVIEAMACGRAVVCSDTSSLPEVADAAALLVNPHATVEVARAMRDVLADPELRQRLERLSLQRAAFFNWTETARKTLDVYYAVAEARRRNPSLAAEPAQAGR
jgi:glycosyltransferase involved in cell wall biosynthesis